MMKKYQEKVALYFYKAAEINLKSVSPFIVKSILFIIQAENTTKLNCFFKLKFNLLQKIQINGYIDTKAKKIIERHHHNHMLFVETKTVYKEKDKLKMSGS